MLFILNSHSLKLALPGNTPGSNSYHTKIYTLMTIILLNSKYRWYN
ncbi:MULTISPECIES: hypothetical protein [unclassified Cytobacillus]|nr:hypothetical protein [Cytobacillus sp. AMY 15.2]KAF0818452.1 hypothetical protein KIS4809_2852 [Bacillus sp. ZZV12-4809]MCM3091529.1 hypothetical protein [Cytobacillus sp. AMY 15.2]